MMTGSDSRSSYKKVAAAVALACAASTAVLAQEGALEEITVTGSFIARPADRPQPVAVMNAEEIRANQRVTLAEVVRDMPQITNANTDSNWETPTNSINLRGLGARSTLILLNGQRMTIDANQGSQVDINNLAPTIMVERMELLLDGASALYGSDAVAGVANFITRDNFEGMEFNISSQWAETQTDTPEVVTGGIFGTGNDNSHLVLGFELQRREDKLQEEDRFGPERLQNGLITALWNPGTFNSATIDPTTLPGGVNFDPENPEGTSYGWQIDPLCDSELIRGAPDPANTIVDPAGYRSGPFCRGLLSLQRTSIPEQTNMTGMAVFTRDFGFGGLETFRFEASYARAEAKSSFGTGVPLLALPSVSGQIPVLPATNPGVIDANQRDPNFPLVDYHTVFSRQLSPLDGDDASLDSRTVQNTYRIAATIDGVFGGDENWDWRVTGTFSQNDQKNNAMDTITDRFMRAIQGYGGPACKWNFVQGAQSDPNVQAGVGACEYWNPFASRLIAAPGDPTYNDPALLQWMMFGGQDLNEARFTSFEAITTGELWEMAGGPTGIAIGAQYRKQELIATVSPIEKDGGLGFNPQILTDWTANRDTNSVFAEVVMYPAQDFEVDIAARYEETLSQSSTEPKISMLWTPTDNLFFRATAGSSFRLASETQIFGIGPGSVARDTIGGEVTQAVGIAVGNLNLVPEESDNWTLGFTWDATDNFTIDMTYWDYEFTNLVSSTDAEDTLRLDLADGWVNADAGNTNPVPRALSPHPLFPGRPNEYCEVTRGWVDVATSGPLPAGCLTGFDFEVFKSSWVNQNIVVTNGVDLTLDWQNDLAGGGMLGFRAIGAFTLEYAGIDNVTGQLRDVVGTDADGVAVPDGPGTNGINPDLRANLIVTYGKGSHNVRGTFRYTSGTELTDTNPLEAAFDQSSYTQLDLVYNWDLPMSNPATLSFTVLNVTDEEPPLDPNGLITYNQALYDGRGRMYRVMWNQGF